MKRWALLVCALVAVLVVSGAAPGAGGKKLSLDMYRATVSAKQYRDLRAKGIATQMSIGQVNASASTSS
jgi:hypothetical protein